MIVPALAATPAPLPAAAVVRRYEHALEALPVPRFQVFEYTVDQVGWHDLAQTHRIYRGRGVERDELIANGGRPLKPALVRVHHGTRDRYAVGNVAPQSAGYTFRLTAIQHAGGRLMYEFKTEPLGPQRSFVVRRVVIDGLSYLPVSLSFETHAARASGAGTMWFAKSGPYWVPTRVTLDASVEGKRATESITFSEYSFPRALPPATFRTGAS